MAHSHDWPDDASSENGQYNCQCVMCGEFFVGHKARRVCRVCDNEHWLDITYKHPKAALWEAMGEPNYG